MPESVGSPVVECPLATLLVKVVRDPEPREGAKTFESTILVKRIEAPDLDKEWAARAKCEVEAKVAKLPPGRYRISAQIPEGKGYKFDAETQAITLTVVKQDPPQESTLFIRVPQVVVVRLRLFRGLSPRTGLVDATFLDSADAELATLSLLPLAEGVVELKIGADVAEQTSKVLLHLLDNSKARVDGLVLTVEKKPDFKKGFVASRALRSLGLVNGAAIAEGVELGKEAAGEQAAVELAVALAPFQKIQSLPIEAFADAQGEALEEKYLDYLPKPSTLQRITFGPPTLETVPLVRLKLVRGSEPREITCDATVEDGDGFGFFTLRHLRTNAGVLEIPVDKERVKDARAVRVTFADGSDGLFLKLVQPDATKGATASRHLRNTGVYFGDPLKDDVDLARDDQSAVDVNVALARFTAGLGQPIEAFGGDAGARFEEAYLDYQLPTEKLAKLVLPDAASELKPFVRVKLVRGSAVRNGKVDAIVEAGDGSPITAVRGIATKDGVLEIPVDQDRHADAKAVRVAFVDVNGDPTGEGLLLKLATPAADKASSASRTLRNLGFFDGEPLADTVDISKDDQASCDVNVALARFQGAAAIDVQAFGPEAIRALDDHYLEYAAGKPKLPKLALPDAKVELKPFIRVKLVRGAEPRDMKADAVLETADGSPICEVKGLASKDGVLEIPCDKDRFADARRVRVAFVDARGKPVGDGLFLHVEKPVAEKASSASRTLRNLGFFDGEPLADTIDLAKDDQASCDVNVALARFQSGAGLDVTAFGPEAIGALDAKYLEYAAGKPKLPKLVLPDAKVELKPFIRVKLVRGSEVRDVRADAIVETADGSPICEVNGIASKSGVLEIPCDKDRFAEAKAVRVAFVDRKGKATGEGMLLHVETPVAEKASSASRTLRNLGLFDGEPLADTVDLAKDDQAASDLNVAFARFQAGAALGSWAFGPEAVTALEGEYLDYSPGKPKLAKLSFLPKPEGAAPEAKKPASKELMQPSWKAGGKPLPVQEHVDQKLKDCKCGVEVLLAEAAIAKPAFDMVFDFLAGLMHPSTTPIMVRKKIRNTDGSFKRAGGKAEGHAITMGALASPTSKAGNKGAPRIAQKCFTKYKRTAKENGTNPLAYINDVVRATMAFDSCRHLTEALKHAVAHSGKPLALADPSVKYEIVRAKQIYTPRSALLYGDVKLNIRVTSAALPEGHNCELQFNLVSMLEGKGTPEGHGAYEAWRDLDDEHWTRKFSELPPRLRDMSPDYRAKAERIVHNSHVAYRKGAIQIQTEADDFDALVTAVSDIARNAAKAGGG